MNDLKKYYQTKSDELGWGNLNSKLDSQRIEFIDKYTVGPKVLDIGCGLGVYCNYLTNKGFQSFGLDFVKEFIDLAKQKHQGTFIVANAEKLPFARYDFDTVLIFDLLEHVDDLKILKEAKRVASKRILIIVPRKVDKRLSDAGVVFRHYIDKSHLREYTKEAIYDLAQKVGLRIAAVVPLHPLYNETIFLALFNDANLSLKVVRKVIFKLFSKHKYFTEYGVVLEK